MGTRNQPHGTTQLVRGVIDDRMACPLPYEEWLTVTAVEILNALQK